MVTVLTILWANLAVGHLTMGLVVQLQIYWSANDPSVTVKVTVKLTFKVTLTEWMKQWQREWEWKWQSPFASKSDTDGDRDSKRGSDGEDKKKRIRRRVTVEMVKDYSDSDNKDLAKLITTEAMTVTATMWVVWCSCRDWAVFVPVSPDVCCSGCEAMPCARESK